MLGNFENNALKSKQIMEPSKVSMYINTGNLVKSVPSVPIQKSTKRNRDSTIYIPYSLK